MTMEQMLTATACVAVLLGVLAWCARTVLGQVKDKPRPWEEVVAVLSGDVERLKTVCEELSGQLRRNTQREIKAAQREKVRATIVEEPKTEATDEEERAPIPPRNGARFDPNLFGPKPGPGGR